MTYIHKAHAFWLYLFHNTTICPYSLSYQQCIQICGCISQTEVMVDFCSIHSSCCLELAITIMLTTQKFTQRLNEREKTHCAGFFF